MNNDTAMILAFILAAVLAFAMGCMYKSDMMEGVWNLRLQGLFESICGKCLEDKKQTTDNCTMCAFCKNKPLMDAYKKKECDE